MLKMRKLLMIKRRQDGSTFMGMFSGFQSTSFSFQQPLVLVLNYSLCKNLLIALSPSVDFFFHFLYYSEFLYACAVQSLCLCNVIFTRNNIIYSDISNSVSFHIVLGLKDMVNGQEKRGKFKEVVGIFIFLLLIRKQEISSLSSLLCPQNIKKFFIIFTLIFFE